MIVPASLANNVAARAMLPVNTMVMPHIDGPMVPLERWIRMQRAEREVLNRPRFVFTLEPSPR